MLSEYMKMRQQMKNGSKNTDQQQRAEDLETKGKQAKISRESKKRKKLNKEYKKVSKPMWEGQKCALKVKGVCTGMAQGWNHAAGKENAEKLLDMENGQPACTKCNVSGGWLYVYTINTDTVYIVEGFSTQYPVSISVKP
jgi:hypothetical protein